MNTIIFNYNTHTYHIMQPGQLPKIVPMSPRAAAHIAVILAARGWKVQHEGLIPEPELDRDAIAADLEAITPKRSMWDKRPIVIQNTTVADFPPGMVGVPAAAARIGCTTGNLYRLLSEGLIPSTRVPSGSKMLHCIQIADIDAYLERKAARRRTDNMPDVEYPTADDIRARANQTESVNIPQAADLLNVSEATVRKLVYAGHLPAYKAPSGKQGRECYWIKQSDILAFADEQA